MILPSALKVFRNRDFAALWSGLVASNIGGQIQMVGAAWMMTAMTSSHAMVSMVQSAASLPILLGSMIAGVLADSYDRRRIMLVAQTFMLIVSVALVVVTLQGGLTPWLLLAFTFLVGSGVALHNPSWHSTLGELVPEADLPAAVSLNAMGMNVTRAVGPASGGLIVAAFGAAAAFAVNAASYVAVLIALLRWRPAPVARDYPREGFLRSMAVGLRYFRLSPRITNPALRAVIYAFAAIPVQSLMPVIVRDQLGGGPTMFGLMLAVYGSGAVTAALANGWMRSRLSSEALCRIGFLTSGLCCVAVGFSSSVALTLVATAVAGFWWLGIFSLLNVTVQLAAPKWVLGRVLSTYLCGMFGSLTLGAWIWGWVADLRAPGLALLGCAAVMVLGAAWGLYRPLQDPGREDAAPATLPRSPALDLPVAGDAGPVTIRITYLIDPADAPGFLSLMRERRRLRLREGGQDWHLEQDVEQPGRWTESYGFPTWLDYLRHHRRRIRADEELVAQLRVLHREAELPRVTRSLAAPGFPR